MSAEKCACGHTEHGVALCYHCKCYPAAPFYRQMVKAPDKPPMTAADLAAHDLGHTVSVNGFRGVLNRIEQAADARYIELRIDAFRCWVKPEQPCTVEVRA